MGEEKKARTDAEMKELTTRESGFCEILDDLHGPEKQLNLAKFNQHRRLYMCSNSSSQ